MNERQFDTETNDHPQHQSHYKILKVMQTPHGAVRTVEYEDNEDVYYCDYTAPYHGNFQ